MKVRVLNIELVNFTGSDGSQVSYSKIHYAGTQRRADGQLKGVEVSFLKGDTSLFHECSVSLPSECELELDLIPGSRGARSVVRSISPVQ